MNQEINRVAEHQWHAVEDDTTVGRGYAAHRPDGRLFLSVDTWQDRVFDRLAAAMLDDLTGPLYVVVDETDHESRSSWERAGFATRRREWEYHVPTDPAVTGLGSVLPPPGVRIVPVGHAEPEPLRELDHAIRTEVE
ncbi:MAG: GNAT family N-acetyltransferase, partial [Nonomuraea sp.]|nr:GNAT family N-acetyltransferase [Nonomuraea sp.]